MPPIERVLKIQNYLTGIMLSDNRLDKYFHLLDTKIFGKNKKAWDYVIKNGRGNEPDLTDICYSCGVTDTSALMDLAYELFTGDPVKYLKEIVARYNYSDPTKLSMELYEATVKLLEEIDNIREGEQEAQYTLQSIALEMMDETYSETRKPIPTLIKELDSILGGGVPVGGVTRITAYSNTGKSKFAYFLASNFLKQGKKILFFNLEVPKETALKNILASYSGSHADYSKDIGDYLNIYADLPLTVVDDKWDWESIKIFSQSCDADVIFLDFVQNIEIQGDGIYEQTSKLAKRIQRFAIENNVTVISISQLSNDGARGYKAGDIIPMKGGGELVASSDICLMLQNDQTNGRMINLTVAKNKFGRKEDTFGLSVDYKNNIFTLVDANVPKSFVK